MTIVQIFTGEDWNAVLYDCIRSNQIIVASIYFVTIICLGSFVMLDFFLAILLSDFDDAAQEEDAYVKKCFFLSFSLSLHSSLKLINYDDDFQFHVRITEFSIIIYIVIMLSLLSTVPQVSGEAAKEERGDTVYAQV
tara:strand:- start:88 stop:498 length:411 start_codon:yes stop_codon:yes gene_type:complete